MSKRRFIITTLILVLSGIGAGILITHLGGEELSEVYALAIFCPIWFTGIYFFIFPVRRRLPLVLAFEKFKLDRRYKKNDRYDICANLIGGLVFSFILIFGWIWGLVKFLILLIRILKGEETDLSLQRNGTDI